jgi:aspartyl-tRNA(Asn)/glutamyl-tRNA(Gln) amidotransferase subunit C
MAVSVNDVEHVASLARLSFSEDEKQRLTTELNSILEYMEQLNGLDTSNVQPLEHVVDVPRVLRPDEHVAGLTRDEALQNAPARTERFFKVSKVIGDR